MEGHRRQLHAFLALHAHKAGPTEEPVAHLHFLPEPAYAGAERALPAPDAPLVSLTRDDVLEALDPQSDLVRGLLTQMSTYDCTRQRIVGLVFDTSTVLAEVLRVPDAALRREMRR